MWPTRLEYSWPFDWYWNDFSKDDRLVKMNLLLIVFLLCENFRWFLCDFKLLRDAQMFSKVKFGRREGEDWETAFWRNKRWLLGFLPTFFYPFRKTPSQNNTCWRLDQNKEFHFYFIFFFAILFWLFFLSAFSYLLYFIMIVSSIEMVVIY